VGATRLEWRVGIEIRGAHRSADRSHTVGFCRVHLFDVDPLWTKITRELRTLFEMFATRNEALTRLVISLARHHPDGEAVLRELALADWGDVMGRSMGMHDREPRFYEIVSDQVARLDEACDRPPETASAR
jgi:hypothetical protein